MSTVSSALTRRTFLAVLVAAGAFGLMLLAVPSYAQSVPAAHAEAPVISLRPAKRCAAAEADAVRTFRMETIIRRIFSIF